MKLIFEFVHKVFPEVSKELNRWSSICCTSEDKVLGKQALSSIRLKKFHAQGGSVYALYPGVDMESTIKFIVALQTISDYLDNLCDRAGVQSEAAFRQLHYSMLDAVDPERSINDYYFFYPFQRDNDYLRRLVEECRSQVSKIPSYNKVIEPIKKYIMMYSDLQTYKHLPHDIREKRMLEWSRSYLGQYPEISCWEFSAATGSTLGIFVLAAAAHDPYLTTEDVMCLEAAYFPWICGLHILLDYYIDSQEDMKEGDLNFTHYYDNLKQCEERLCLFIERSLENCMKLRYPKFHTTVVKGLLAMYLSDPKALFGLNRLASWNLIKNGAHGTTLYYRLCRLLRFAGAL
ncbi:MAG: tetraprenyl-beta-curcumene synthase family protein [Clostridia bacterium]|nr:tetraprenyl-beta-curcumene synthase family protein [Clostridia bacterium]